MSDSNGVSILERIEAAGRKVLPMHKFLAESDPMGLDVFDRFLSHAIYSDGGLQEAHKEMILACVCVAFGSSQPVIVNHCRKALAAGLERKHLVQALEITAAVAATKTLAIGINSVIDVENQ